MLAVVVVLYLINLPLWSYPGREWSQKDILPGFGLIKAGLFRSDVLPVAQLTA